VPCGQDSLGLPIGLQLMAKEWNEASMLKGAADYERESGLKQIRPTF